MDTDQTEPEHTEASPTEPDTTPSPEPEITETISAQLRTTVQHDETIASPALSPTEPMDLTPDVDDLLLSEHRMNDPTEPTEEDEADSRSRTEEMEETGVRPRVLSPPVDHSDEELEW